MYTQTRTQGARGQTPLEIPGGEVGPLRVAASDGLEGATVCPRGRLLLLLGDRPRHAPAHRGEGHAWTPPEFNAANL